MNRNYMVVLSEQGLNETYTMRMLSGNRIPGLLAFQEKWLDGVPLFYYDITSKQPLNRLIERRKMTGAEIHTLVSDLILVLRQMERFLLDEQRICLKSEYVYIDPETGHGCFCLIPGYQSDFTRAFFDFAQYILENVNHSDGEAVVLAFSIFRESQKENFGVDDIERCLGREQKKDERKEAPKQEAEITIEQDERVEVPEKRNYFFIAIIAGMILFGILLLLRRKWVILAIEMLLAAVGIVGYYFLKGADGKELETSDAYEFGDFIWEFDEELKNESTAPMNDHTEREPEDDMQTVLLISQNELRKKRKLVSLTDNKEISVDYFPFLIGKSKGMVDACLSEPGVSRLHAKIEQEGAEYFITDLNSTNGTRINGSLLEANEKKQIRIGDELDFAGILFQFL